MILRLIAILMLLAAPARAGGLPDGQLGADDVAAALTVVLEAGGGRVERIDTGTLRVLTADGTRDIALDNLRRHLNRTPTGERDAELARWARIYLAETAEAPAEAAGALDALRPTVYPAAYLDHVRTTGLAAAGARPVAGVLWAALVLDSPASAALFTEADGAALGIDGAAAEARAFANLRALLPNLRIAREGTIGWLELDGYYENALILLPEVWEEVDALLEGRPVMITPARGQVFFASEHDAAALAEMADYAFAAQASEPGPISAEMYLWTGAGWELFRR